jgi:biopolymer transport protein ExbB/TolQ
VKQLKQWFASLVHSPLLWGGLLSAAYYGALFGGLIDFPILLRFTAGHSVEFIVTVAFFIGVAALSVKALEVAKQRSVPQQHLLGPVPMGGQAVSDAASLLLRLNDAPANLRGGYLLRRLREALDHLHRKGEAESLDNEIKYLSDLDALRAQHGYAFVRVIIWSIPILGLLGTVVGITSVFANLDLKHFDASLPSVLDGMKVAFDTTGLALGLSMLLMFGQYFVDRSESALLSEVDARMNSELIGRFASSGGGDPQMAGIRRMMEAVVQSTDRLVSRQTELWRGTIDAAEDRHRQLSVAGAQQLETALSAALENSLKSHAATLVASEQGFAEQNQRQWTGVQQSLAETAAAAANQQAELAKQSEVLLKIVEAGSHIAQLEQTLNRNLSALAASRNFDETLVALSAAVQLLSARLGQSTGEPQPISLGKTRRTDKAA